jgi:3-methyladenine DNA glycosylase Tag
MHAPEQIVPHGLADYLDVMSKSVFQSGISWAVVDAKWPGTREALYGFDPKRLSELTPEDVDRLAADTRLVRNRRKIEATIDNAETMLDLEREHGTFPAYLRSFADYDALARDLVKRFKFLGDMGAYHFLYVVGEPVPSWDEWCATHHTAAPGTSRRGSRKA